MGRTKIQSPDIAANAVSADKLADSGVSAGTYSAPNITINAKGIVTSVSSGSISPDQISPQGSGSGLDADKLDGLHASAFSTISHSHALFNLTDVSPVGSVSDGQVLIYDDASSRWINASPSFGGVTDHGALIGLTDDDHTQYLTSPRANTWLSTKTTTNLTEGSNLYFTDERVQDVVGAMVSPSSTIRWSYSDAAGKIQASVSPANISHALLSGLTTGDPHTQYQLESGKNQVSGYMGLDSSGLASPSRLGTGTANSGTWLRGDGSWQAISIPTPGDSITINSVAVTDADFNSTTPAAPATTAVVRWQRTGSGPTSISAYVSPGNVDHGLLAGLGDDDHTQYHNTTRADTWLGTKTTTNLAEGTNLYHTPERVQDEVGSMVSPSSTITWSYNDSAGKITATVVQAAIDHGSISGLSDDDHTQYHNDSRALTWLGTRSTTDLPEGSNQYYTDEKVQDAVGAMVSPSSTIRWSYSDAAGKISATVSPANISHSLLADLTTGDPHTQYQLESEKNAVNGYAGLDSATKISSPLLHSGVMIAYKSNTLSGSIVATSAGGIDLSLGELIIPFTPGSSAGTVWISSADFKFYDNDLGVIQTVERQSNKNVANGYAGLNGSGLVSPSRIPAMPLSFLSDVSPSSVSNGQVLTYHAASGQWRNTSPATPVVDHGALTGLSDDDHSQYHTDARASTWLGTKSIGDLLDVSPSTLSDGQVLTWDDPSGRWRNETIPSGVTDHGLLTGLGDDDHTQYLTSPRALTWLGTRSTSDLSEGTNQYYTDEKVQDAVGAMVSPSSTIRWSYNDSAGKIQAFVSPANIDHGALGGLSDDDHTQYHNSTRADTWLGTKTTTNLAEGTNLYHTPERVQDEVGSMVSPSSTITWSYNDSAGKITAAIVQAGVDHGSISGLSDDDHTQYHNDSRATTWLGTKNISELLDVSPTSASTGQVLTYNATSGRWYNASPSAAYTNEQAQDAVGSILTNTSTIKWTYNDGSNTISADVSPANISHNSLSNLTTGDPHTQYQLRSEKNSANGYMGLDASGRGSPSRFGSGTANSTTYLRGDGSWQIISIPTPGDSIEINSVAVTDANFNNTTPVAPASTVLIKWQRSGSAPTNISAYLSPGVVDHGLLTGLGDDDHTQYHNDSRADTWLGTKSTTNLSEGTNLYYTPERVQDEVGAMVSPSSTIRWTYNDAAGKIQAFVSPANISHASLADLTSGDPHTQYQKESEKNAANGYAGLDSATKISSPYLHSGVMIGYKANSLSGSITLGTGSEIHAGMGTLRLPSVSPSVLTTGAIWVDTVDFKTIRYFDTDDGSTEYSIETHQNKNVANGYAGLDAATKISSPLLHSGVMIAYKSNSLSGTITATSSGGVDVSAGSLVVPFTTGTAAGNLWMDSADLKFYDNDLGVIQTAERLSRRNVNSGYAGLDSSGLLSPSRIANDSITFARFQNLNADRLVGRDTAGSGDAAEISLTNGLAFTGSDSIGISTNGVSNSMLAQAVAYTLKGNNTGVTADVADLSPALVTAMLNSFTSALKGLAPASGGGTAKFLRADGTWASPPSGGSLSLSQLTDVSPSSVSNGQVLTYHTASGQWRNTSPTSGGVTDHGALTGLGDDDHPQYILQDGTRSFNDSALKLRDQINSNDLTFAVADLSGGDRVLTLEMFGGDRNLTLKGDATLFAGSLAGTNSGDVTLAGSYDYITISGQVITRGQIDLTTDVTGDLPLSNLAPSGSASRLLGRGSASAGDYQEITIGSGLSMSGTTLSSTGGASALGDLTDVSPASLADGQVLTYNSASGQWRNETPASGSGLTQAQVLARISFRG